MENSLRTAVLALAIGITGVSQSAMAQTFPTKAVTIVVPYSPGGGTDTIARRLGQALSEHWKQTVLVENVPGADGVIGTQRVLRAPPDGYTLLMGLNQMLLWPTTLPSAGIDILKDVRLISKIQHSPAALAVSVKFPGNSIKEFAAWCKLASAPCSWGSSTQAAQMGGSQLMELAGVSNAVKIPYKGTTPMITDVIGGHVTLGLVTVASGAPHLKSGALKFLAIGSLDRFAAVPGVQTMQEQGYPVHLDTWYGIMVGRNTPQPVVDAIDAGIRAVSRDPGLLKAIDAGGGAPIFAGPQQFQREVEDELKSLTPLLAKLPKAGS